MKRGKSIEIEGCQGCLFRVSLICNYYRRSICGPSASSEIWADEGWRAEYCRVDYVLVIETEKGKDDG